MSSSSSSSSSPVVGEVVRDAEPLGERLGVAGVGEATANSSACGHRLQRLGMDRGDELRADQPDSYRPFHVRETSHIGGYESLSICPQSLQTPEPC